MINYRQLDGTMSQGVLYLPENFDPKKKYPVIFNLYEQLSHLMYEYPYVGLTGDNINYPWFVSRGYLVVAPDIHYQNASKTNKTIGWSACNSVVAAALYLSKLPYIDSKHMALQGHSFGAEQTNYIVAHSHLFAAASEMSGPSDAVSDYLSLLPTAGELSYETRDNQNYAVMETAQNRIGATLWQRPDLYFDLSPVLRANKITTPMLMVHNRKDNAVSYYQGVELYMALRRLEKPAWMLQYDNGGHAIYGKDAKDYTIRLTQFFDHLLRGYPPPVWMTKGIPANLKGIITGYELDPKGSCSPSCPVCKKKNYKNFDPSVAVISKMVGPGT